MLPTYCAQKQRHFLLIIGVLALLVGVLTYVATRSGAVVFVPDEFKGSEWGLMARPLTYQVPTFVHTFAFSLFVGLLWANTRRAGLLGCLSVVILELALEFSQATILANRIADSFSPALANVPILGIFPNYAIRGTFDMWDVVSILLGGGVAALTVRNYSGRGNKNETNA